MSGSYINDSGGGEWGVEVGLNADVRLFANVEFVAGLYVLHQEGGRKVETVDSDELLGYKFAYMHVPVMLRPMFRLGDGSWSVGPFSGVYVGFNGSCKTKEAKYFEFEHDCGDDTPGGSGAATQVGIPIGVDLIHDFVGGARWMFTARVDWGLTSVLDGASDAGLSATSRLIVVGFGFTYPLY